MLTLVHILGTDAPEDGTIKARATVRTGTPEIGDSLWLEDPKGDRRGLTIVSLQPTPRWSTIVLSGREQDLERIVTGTYLLGGSEADKIVPHSKKS